jgi:hypothetical protein
MAATEENETGFDPKRRLCPDGSCVGVIGGDGKCMICGTQDAGGDATISMDGDVPDDQAEFCDEDRASSEPGGEVSGFDPNRRLCSDEACIGVIGEDNRCSECGKPAGG